jgi:hypothetical protein
MDWQLAITRNRGALLVIIVALMKSVGLVDGGMLTTLPRLLYARALAIIRPAESAVRRLIMIAAHLLPVRVFGPRKTRATSTNFALLRSLQHSHVPAFHLIDPRKHFGLQSPDFEYLDAAFDDEPTNITHMSAITRISAVTLGRRLLALKNALDTIPLQAKRLARWYAARDLAHRQNKLHLMSPMRPGPPIGLPRGKRSEIQEVLRECHLLAIYARDQHDSS